jgi:hypothetical protein
LIEGRTHESGVLLEGALKLSEENGLITQQLRALINMSSNNQQIHPAIALETARSATEIAARYGLASSFAIVLANVIEAGNYLGEWELVRSTIAENIDSVGDFAGVLSSSRTILEAFTGNLEAAEGFRAEFEAFVGDATSKQDQAELAAARGSISFVRGDLEGAIEAVAAERAAGSTRLLDLVGIAFAAGLWAGDLEAAREQKAWLEASILQNRWTSCRIRTLDAGIAALEGDRDGAAGLFQEVLRDWDELEIPLGQALAQMTYLFLVGGPEAAEVARGAEAFFANAGNDLFVRKIREAITH